MALTVDPWTHTYLSDKRMCYTEVEGDGSTGTISVPMGRIEAAWLQAATKAGTVETSMPSISSWSGSTITYSANPSNGKRHILFVIGTD